MKKEYSADFLAFMEVYPKRDRPHDRVGAYKNWLTRLKEEDVTAELLTNCAREYSGDCHRKGKNGTEYVMHAATFLGPNERWRAYEPRPEPARPVKTPKEISTPDEPRIDARPFLKEIIQKLASSKKSPTCVFVRSDSN